MSRAGTIMGRIVARRKGRIYWRMLSLHSNDRIYQPNNKGRPDDVSKTVKNAMETQITTTAVAVLKPPSGKKIGWDDAQSFTDLAVDTHNTSTCTATPDPTVVKLLFHNGKSVEAMKVRVLRRLYP